MATGRGGDVGTWGTWVGRGGRGWDVRDVGGDVRDVGGILGNVIKNVGLWDMGTWGRGDVGDVGSRGRDWDVGDMIGTRGTWLERGDMVRNVDDVGTWGTWFGTWGTWDVGRG